MNTKSIVNGIGMSLSITLGISVIVLYGIGMRHTYTSHSDKAFYISMMPPAGIYWGVECLLHKTPEEEIEQEIKQPQRDSLSPDQGEYKSASINDERSERRDIMKFKLMSRTEGCDASVVFNNPRATYDNNEDRYNILYLHWKLQKKKVLAQQELINKIALSIKKATDKQGVIDGVKEMRKYVDKEVESLSQTKTLDETLVLYGLLYSYNCDLSSLLGNILDEIKKVSTAEQATDVFFKFILDNSEKEAKDVERINKEFDTIAATYHLNK